MIIAINSKGICTAYKRQDLTFLCLINKTLNQRHLEKIKSIFYNKYNDSLIVVRDATLNIRSIPIKYIETKQPHLGQSILNSERMKDPGFFEFDSPNKCILTYNYYDPINDDSNSNNINHQLSQIIYISILVCFSFLFFIVGMRVGCDTIWQRVSKILISTKCIH